MSLPTERDLRFCVQTTEARTEIRYFASPQDHEGLTLYLTPKERRQLAAALRKPGTVFLARDDAKTL